MCVGGGADRGFWLKGGREGGGGLTALGFGWWADLVAGLAF